MNSLPLQSVNGDSKDRDHSWTYLFNGYSDRGYHMASKTSYVDAIICVVAWLTVPMLKSFVIWTAWVLQQLQWWALVHVKKDSESAFIHPYHLHTSCRALGVLDQCAACIYMCKLDCFS